MRDDDVKRPQRGLTLLELLVALAIMSVVAGLGVPALRDVTANARRVASVNGMLGAIQFARSAALTRDATTVLCQTSDALSCSGRVGDGSRWIIAVDAATDMPGAASSQQILRVVQLSFSDTIISNRSRFEFRPFPLRSTNGTISFCDTRGGRAQRAIVISYSGRPRLAAPATENGYPACASG